MLPLARAVLLPLFLLAPTRAAALETMPFSPTPLPQTVRPDPLPEGMVAGWPKLPAGQAYSALGRCKPTLEGLRIPRRTYPSSQDPQASRLIQMLVDRDQTARKNGTYNEADDLKNRVAVLPLIPRASTAQDLAGIALIFQHGNCTAHFQLTAVLAARGGNPWLAAAAIDRALMNLGKAQKYGTQYLPRALGRNCLALYMTDLRTTDAKRTAMNVPTLKQALERAKMLSDKNCP